MLLLREHGRHGWCDAAESQPVLPNQHVKRLDDLVPDPEVDVKADERAAVETCIHGEPGATFRSLIERHHRPANDEREEVRQANLCGRAQVIEQREPWRSLGDEKLLRRYVRARAAPTWAMGRLTDGLLQLFSSPHPGAQELRNRGLTLVNKLAPLKRWLVSRALGT
jgi:hypothetical protein